MQVYIQGVPAVQAVPLWNDVIVAALDQADDLELPWQPSCLMQLRYQALLNQPVGRRRLAQPAQLMALTSQRNSRLSLPSAAEFVENASVQQNSWSTDAAMILPLSQGMDLHRNA